MTSPPWLAVVPGIYKAFYFYKMFYGRAYPNFSQNEIKIKVIDFSFIFIFFLCLSETACS